MSGEIAIVVVLPEIEATASAQTGLPTISATYDPDASDVPAE